MSENQKPDAAVVINSNALFETYARIINPSWVDFYKGLYKRSDCGLHVGILFHGEREPVYNSDLAKYSKNHVAVELYLGTGGRSGPGRGEWVVRLNKRSVRGVRLRITTCLRQLDNDPT